MPNQISIFKYNKNSALMIYMKALYEIEIPHKNDYASTLCMSRTGTGQS
jgi:hypothetical protein